MAEQIAVSVRRLCKRYDDVVALKDVDLSVEVGAVHGLLGPNGAGKTTLLRILLGLVRADSGEVELFGRRREQVGQAVLDGVGGFVETPRCYPYLTGLRNVELLSRLDGPGGLPAGEALERVGLGSRAGTRVGGWSLGMRQRLGLAAALVRSPRLLVVDEPGNGLDPVGARELRAVLTDLAAAGTTVLLSSHDMAEVEQLCSSVTVVGRGSVAFAGPLTALRARAPDPYAQLATSDDDAAAVLAGSALVWQDQDGLRLRAGTARLDALGHELSRAGIAVRGLRREQTPLEDLVLGLTEPVLSR